MTEAQLSNAMDAYGSTVYRLALTRMQNIADAEDVYQEVFLRLWKQAAEDSDGDLAKAWLIRTTLNRCADLHRFRLRRPVLSFAEIPDLAQPEDESRELWEAVSRLPEKARTAVHLYYAEGYSAEEISQLMHIPAATVRTRLHRARKQLKELLGGIDDETCVSRSDGTNFGPRRAE